MSKGAFKVCGLVALTILSACASKRSLMGPDDFYRTYGVDSHSTGPNADYALRGARLPNRRSGSERDNLIAIVESVASECPSLAKSLFYVDCSAEPCGIFLSEVGIFQDQVWRDVTCDDPRLGGFAAVRLSIGSEDHEVSWVVASPADTDVLLAAGRLREDWPIHKLIVEVQKQLGVASR